MRSVPSKYNYHHEIDSRYSLINNTLTGAIDIIENSYVPLLLGKQDSSKKGKKLLLEMIDRGYLYRDEKKEEELFRTIYKNYLEKAKTRPVRYVFCPTYTCNLSCSYCFEDQKLKGNFNKRLLTKSIQAVEKISRRNSESIEGIELFGGEPLLPGMETIVQSIIGLALNRKTDITIISNGVYAKDFIKVLRPAKDLIEMVQITLDGPERIHDKRRFKSNGKGSFSDISESIDRLLDEGIKVNLRTNIDACNLGHLPELYEYVSLKKWLDSNYFTWRPFMVTDHKNQNYLYPILSPVELLSRVMDLYDHHPELEELFGFYMFKPLRHILDILNGAPNVAPRFFNCESNLLELMIFCPDGHIYACPESIGDIRFATGKFYPELVFFPEKEKMWSGRDINTLEGCNNCSFAPLCGGGCTFSSMLIHGDGEHPICEPFGEILDLFIQRRGKRIFSDYLDAKRTKTPDQRAL